MVKSMDTLIYRRYEMLRCITLIEFFLVAFFAVPGDGHSENLISGDSSFETGINDMIVSSRHGNISWNLDITADAIDGQQCIKLRYESSDWTRCKPFVIPDELDGKDFTFSVFIKAERNGVPAKLLMVRTDWGHTVSEQPFTLTKEWKRYSISGKLKKGEYWMGVALQKPGTVWCDAFQIEKDRKTSSYRNNPDICFDISVPAENNFVFFDSEEIPMAVTVANLTNTQISGNLVLALKIKDCFGKVFEEREWNVVLKTNRFKLQHVLKPSALGWYSLAFELSNGDKTIDRKNCFVTVVRPPVAINKNMIPFCGSVGLATNGVVRIGSHWQELELLRWRLCEPKKGQYIWGDYSVAHKKGLKAKLFLFHDAPEWTWDPVEKKECEKKHFDIGKYGLLPTMEHMDDWRNFVHELVVRFKDQLDIIEIGAEDDLRIGRHPYYIGKYPEFVKNGFITGGPAYERYTGMIKTACEEIRKLAPQIKIGIIRPSGVDCTDVKPNFSFSTPIIKNNRELFDLFPVDCYCFPRYIGPGLVEPPLPEDFLYDDLNTALARCREVGKGQSVYISEFGYALDNSVAYDSSYALEMVKRLVRSFLIARGVPGVISLQWFHTIGCIEGRKYNYGLWQSGVPLPTVPAYSAVARIVENVEHSRELNLGGNSRAVVFKKDGHADAAVWFVRGNGKLIFDEIPSNVTITDVMGNHVQINNPPFLSKIQDSLLFKKSNIAIDIGEFPLYFSIDGDDSFEQLIDILSKTKMKSKPVKISFVTPKCDKGTLCLKNLESVDIKGTLTVNGIPEDVSLKKGQTVNVGVDINKDMTALDVSLDCGNCYEKVSTVWPLNFEECRYIAFNGKIDAELSEWKNRPFIAMNERSQIMPPDPWIDYRGPEQFSAKVYTGWDQKYFYMAAEVKDEIHVNKFPGEIYKGDCMQFAFAPCTYERGLAYAKEDSELGIALISGETVVSQWAGTRAWKNAEYAIKRDEKTKKTFYEMRIPLADLKINKVEKTVFGFNFAIFNDDSGSGANYWTQLSPGITGGKKPEVFKKFTLIK